MEYPAGVQCTITAAEDDRTANQKYLDFYLYPLSASAESAHQQNQRISRILFWNTFLGYWWCSDDALMMRWWCVDDTLMMRSGCDLWLSCLISLNPLLFKNVAHIGVFSVLCLCLYLCLGVQNPRSRDISQDFPRLSRFPSGFFLGKSLGSREIFGRRGWIFQYLPRLGGARIQYNIHWVFEALCICLCRQMTADTILCPAVYDMWGLAWSWDDDKGLYSKF